MHRTRFVPRASQILPLSIFYWAVYTASVIVFTGVALLLSFMGTTELEALVAALCTSSLFFIGAYALRFVSVRRTKKTNGTLSQISTDGDAIVAKNVEKLKVRTRSLDLQPSFEMFEDLPPTYNYPAHAAVAIRGEQIFLPLPNFRILPNSIRLNWAYAVADRRDLRLDFLRGFAVVAMITSHIGGSSWLYFFTGGNAFFVSWTEAFIFISGLVVGIVYGSIALRLGLRVAQIRALARALTLYKLTVVTTLLFATLSLFFDLPWARNLIVDNPLRFAFDVITLRQTLYLADTMLMYTFLMLFVPLGLWLLVKKRTGLMLVGSGGLWLLCQLFPAQVQVPWPIMGTATNNLAAWQLLFFYAMAIGYHRDATATRLRELPRWPYFVLSGLVLLWLIQFYTTNGTFLEGLVPGLDVQTLLSVMFNKTALAPGRLLASFFVFQFAYLVVTLFWKPFVVALGWLLMPLGQNALYSYTMHVIVIGLFYIVLPYLPEGLQTMATINTFIQIIVVLLIWAMIRRNFLFAVIPR